MKKTIFFSILLVLSTILACTECPWDNKYEEAYVDSYGTLYVSKGLDSAAICLEDNSYIPSPKNGICVDNYGQHVRLRRLDGFDLGGITTPYDEDDYFNKRIGIV